MDVAEELKFDAPILNFPSNFLWGTATAAFQIEGHPEEYLGKLSDWSEWIDRKDKVLRPSNDGRAVNHYEHMIEDVALIRGLNNNAYRFSFNWARLHRAPGQFDENTAKFYDQLLEQLLGKQEGNNYFDRPGKIEPFATLVHFVLPKWLADKGGWENPETAQEFANFTRFLAERYQGKIKHWITHNEPNIFLGFGYESGIWPPGYQNEYGRYFKAYQGLLLGHQLAYKTIKEIDPKAQVGFSQNLYSFEAFDEVAESFASHEKTYRKPYQNLDAVPNIIRKQLHNHLFIESCAEMGALDFLGVNYYTRFSYQLNPKAKDFADTKLDSFLIGQLQDLKKEFPENVQSNSLNWEVYPEGLYKVLSDRSLKKTIGNIPLYITENGYSHIEDGQADIEDDYRIDFIRRHLIATHKAINEGHNIQGYFYWSLLDNFEWALGMKPRFGLVHVDHDSFKRSPKNSYQFYAQVAAQNGLEAIQKHQESKELIESAS